MLTIVGFRVFFNVRIVCGAKTKRICNCSYPGTFLRSRRDICFWTFHIKKRDVERVPNFAQKRSDNNGALVNFKIEIERIPIPQLNLMNIPLESDLF